MREPLSSHDSGSRRLYPRRHPARASRHSNRPISSAQQNNDFCLSLNIENIIFIFAVYKNIVSMFPLDLDKIRKYFATQPVEKAWIFGSYARGEQTPDSDVDILVTYTPGVRPGLFGIFDMTEDLQKILGCKVDLVEQGRLYPRVAREVELQKIPVYERRP